VTGRLPDTSYAAPRLSVIVFVRNAVNSVERALKSVVNYPNSSVELLVLDGGSTDGTVEIIRRYQDRIAFWRTFPDGGPIYAVKEGVERATGDAICLLPADDWLEPGALDYIVREFAADPDLDVLSCGIRFIHYESDERLVVDAEVLHPNDLEFTIHNVVRQVISGGRFIRRRVYQRMGGFDPAYSISNDLDFFIRVILARPKTRVLSRLVYTYWRNPESRTMGRDPDMDMAMMRDNIRLAAHYMTDPSARPDEQLELRGFHGRCCARLVWMSMVRGKLVEAVSVLRQAIAKNHLWPVQVIYWSFRHVLGSKRFV